MGSSLHLEVILGVKETFFFSFFFPLGGVGVFVTPEGSASRLKAAG